MPEYITLLHAMEYHRKCVNKCQQPHNSIASENTTRTASPVSRCSYCEAREHFYYGRLHTYHRPTVLHHINFGTWQNNNKGHRTVFWYIKAAQKELHSTLTI